LDIYFENGEVGCLRTRENRQIEVEVFAYMFKNDDLTYESLIENSTEESGWHEIFNEWKRKDIIN